MTKKISNQNLINVLIFAVCALASAFLFLTTLDREITSMEKKEWNGTR